MTYDQGVGVEPAASSPRPPTGAEQLEASLARGTGRSPPGRGSVLRAGPGLRALPRRSRPGAARPGLAGGGSSRGSAASTARPVPAVRGARTATWRRWRPSCRRCARPTSRRCSPAARTRARTLDRGPVGVVVVRDGVRRMAHLAHEQAHELARERGRTRGTAARPRSRSVQAASSPCRLAEVVDGTPASRRATRRCRRPPSGRPRRRRVGMAVELLARAVGPPEDRAW